MNVFQTLQALSTSQQTLRTVGKIGTTLPRQQDENRTVKSIFDRGGSMWSVKVAKDKPEIYLCCRDNKTHDAETDSFDWTSIVVSMYRVNRFSLINNPFAARLTRSMYEQFVNSGACPPNADLSKPVLVDLRNIAAFPERNFDEDYIEDKISLLGMEAKLKELNYLKQQAVKYGRSKGLDWAPAARTRQSHPDWVTVSIPTTSYTVEIEGLPEINGGVDASQYRVKEGRGYVYTEENYNALVSAIETLKPVYKALGQTVRVTELAALEHYGWTGGAEIGQYKVKQILVPACEEKRCSAEDAAKFIKNNPHAFISKQPVPTAVEAEPANV